MWHDLAVSLVLLALTLRLEWLERKHEQLVQALTEAAAIEKVD